MTSDSQVVEFTLGQERYCISIEHVSGIADLDETALTELPGSPRHVEGLLDLRGNAARIMNPKRRFDTGDTSVGDRVIIFEGNEEEEGEHIGWAVDDVEQVSQVQSGSIEDADDSDALKGIISRDDDFILWAKPDLGLGG